MEEQKTSAEGVTVSIETEEDKNTFLIPGNDQSLLDENGDWIKLARHWIGLILTNLAVGLSLLTFLGFLVITAYIGSKSNLFTLNINPGYYIIAGINLLFGYLKFAGIIVQQNFFLSLFVLVVLGLLVVGLVAGISRLIRAYPSSREIFYFVLPPFLSFLCVLALALTYAYGEVLYSQESQLLGGARTHDVILVFSEGELENFTGIISADAQYPNRTAIVEMLFERTDGWMIRDKTTCQTLFIKSELVQAIVDPSPRFASTPTTSASPTSTIIPTVTPTPIGPVATPSPTATPHPGCKTSP